MAKFRKAVKKAIELKDIMEYLITVDERGLDMFKKCLEAREVRDLIRKNNEKGDGFSTKEPTINYAVTKKPGV